MVRGSFIYTSHISSMVVAHIIVSSSVNEIYLFDFQNEHGVNILFYDKGDQCCVGIECIFIYKLLYIW